jgi:maleate cis-trans isomerase
MGLRSIEVIGALEQDLEVPVFSSNVATLWMLLRLAGVAPTAARYQAGALFKR